MTKFVVFVSTTLMMLQQRGEKKDKGATMVEYGLLVALIAVVVAVAAALLGLLAARFRRGRWRRVGPLQRTWPPDDLHLRLQPGALGVQSRRLHGFHKHGGRVARGA